MLTCFTLVAGLLAHPVNLPEFRDVTAETQDENGQTVTTTEQEKVDHGDLICFDKATGDKMVAAMLAPAQDRMQYNAKGEAEPDEYARAYYEAVIKPAAEAREKALSKVNGRDK